MATPAGTMRGPRPAGVSGDARQAVARLAAIELRGTPDVYAYASLMREIALNLSMEADMTAHELQRRLEKGAGLMDRVHARMAARKVTRRMRMTAGSFHQAADDAARFWVEYSRVYAELINPAPAGSRNTWKWTEGNGRRSP